KISSLLLFESMSRSCFMAGALPCSGFEDTFAVTPVAYISLRCFAERILDQFERVLVLRRNQLLGHQRRYRPHVFLVQPKDIGPVRRLPASSRRAGAKLELPRTRPRNRPPRLWIVQKVDDLVLPVAPHPRCQEHSAVRTHREP